MKKGSLDKFSAGGKMKIKYFIMMGVLIMGGWTPGNAATISNETLTNAIEKVLQERPDLILDILRRNSEAVLDIAQQGSNLRRKNNLEAQWKEDLKKPKDVKISGRPVLGPKDAKVKVVAFSDFTCHFCEQASKNVDKLLKEYPEDICLVFKHLPLDEKGPGGVASQYFVAIAQQDEGKAWDFYREMFANREKLLAEGEPFIKKTVSEMNIDTKRLQKDLKSKYVQEILKEDEKDAQKLGVEGTPYFLVNDLVVRGALPLELFKGAVEMAKNNAGDKS